MAANQSMPLSLEAIFADALASVTNAASFFPVTVCVVAMNRAAGSRPQYQGFAR